uniref:Transmembrane protein n=1 Tax=Entomoneis paludosa TaxID=265537 RepID=A0A6U3AXA3_9STRA|mmetsp:Transcript_27653/g.57877  ORF Transcript_27653/g.57877 Transcript_27653/m.57877 type:complete len:294 (+) Transcript_27653:109-990(+)
MLGNQHSVYVRLRSDGGVVGLRSRFPQTSSLSRTSTTSSSSITPRRRNPLHLLEDDDDDLATSSSSSRSFLFHQQQQHALNNGGMGDPSALSSSISFQWQWPVWNLVTRSTRSVFEIAQDVWEQSTEVLASTHIETKLVQRLSILLILAEFVRQRLIDCLEEAIQASAAAAALSSSTDPAVVAASNIPMASPTLEIQVIWLIPIFTAIASFSFFLSLMVQLQPTSHALVLVGLISLALVECLVPLALTGCTALFWFDVFSAETALLVLFIVWVASAVSSRCIRHCLYPNLGHG